MEAYILIVIFSAYSGPSIAMQEFGDKKACMFAARQIVDNWRGNQPPKATLCVPKRLEKAKGE